MSKILTHYSPREWNLIRKHEAHDTEALPNRIRTPAPASDSWWYQLRSPRCDGVKSAQHKRNLAALKEIQNENKQRKQDAKQKQERDHERELRLRARTAKSVSSGAKKLEQFCVSPKRNTLAVHANLDENGDEMNIQSTRSEPNVLLIGENDVSAPPDVSNMATNFPTHQDQTKRSPPAALSPSRLNVRSATTSAVKKVVTTPQSTTSSQVQPQRSSLLSKDPQQTSAAMSPRKLAKSNVSSGPQLTPMDAGVRDHTFSCLQQRRSELELQLQQFPLAPSLAQLAKKGEVEKELRQIDRCLVVYQFPVVMKRHTDPVQGSCTTLVTNDRNRRPISARPVKKRREWKV